MRISGTVCGQDERPLSGYPVVAYHGDVNLKKERRLADAETGEDGFYLLEVNLTKYRLGVNLRVAVFRGKSKELWSSPIHYNAKDDLVIDAEIPDAALGISEYRRLTDEISPLLQGAEIAELQPTQVAHLAGRSAVAPSQLNLLVSAARLHGEIPDLSQDACYALLSEGMPSRVDDLLALTRTDWQAALDVAGRAHIAPLSRPKKAAAIAALNERKSA
jgi:hypothetical protein